MNTCLWHLCQQPAKQKFCSFSCKNKYSVDRRRKQLKLKALEYKGNCCILCGYSRCPAALVFHHIDPNQKDFGISNGGITRSWDKTKAELDKCVLLCANCHHEVHNGLVVVSSF